MSYDLFLNDTARRFADVVLPGTAWLEEVGCKMTHTHLYLMERALEPPGRDAFALPRDERAGGATRPRRLPSVGDGGGDDRRDPRPSAAPGTPRWRRCGRGRHPRARRVARRESALDFDTPSGKIELYSEQAAALGLPPLPSFAAPAPAAPAILSR